MVSRVSSNRPKGLSVKTRAGGLRILRQGRGEPALLLHGIGSSADAFRRQLADLSDEFDLVAWDAPGYARSADVAHPLTLDGYAQAAVDLLDALDLAVTHVTGVSWGGAVALGVALGQPARVASLALIGSTPGLATDPAAAGGLRTRAERIERNGVAAYARVRATEVLSDHASPALVKEEQEIMLASVRARGFRSAAESLARADYGPELKRVRARTLVLVGEDDEVTGLKQSKALAEGIPRARLVVIRSAGHHANEEQPKVVNSELRNHWRSNSRSV
jgi:3-oxoadipate enol-lactonase